MTPLQQWYSDGLEAIMGDGQDKYTLEHLIGDLSLIRQKLDFKESEIADIKNTIREINGKIDAIQLRLEKLCSEFSPVQKVVYTLISVTLIAVVTAMVALVIKK